MQFIIIGILIVASAFVIFNIVRYKKDIYAADERLKTLGGELIYTEYGTVEYIIRGDGSPVLVIHGAMGGFDQGLSVSNEFLDSDYQSISVSRFGYLRSDIPENPTITLQADVYNSFLDALHITTRVAVFGISAGASSAIRFAARYPERVSALILLSPAAPGNEMRKNPPRALFDAFIRSNFIYWMFVTYAGAGMNSMIGVPKGLKLTPDLKSEIKETAITTMPSSRRINGMIFDMFTSNDEFRQSITEKSPYPLGVIKSPVLVISAKDDPLTLHENVKNLAELFPNCRLFTASDGGHEILGHKREVKTEILKFLSATKNS